MYADVHAGRHADPRGRGRGRLKYREDSLGSGILRLGERERAGRVPSPESHVAAIASRGRSVGVEIGLVVHKRVRMCL